MGIFNNTRSSETNHPKEDCVDCASLQKEFEKNPGGKKHRLIGLVFAGIAGGAALTLSGICLPFVAPAFRRICLPYVPATDTQIGNVIRALNGRKRTTLVDIGSGDGRIVFHCADHGFHAEGIELNPWLVLYSKVKNLFFYSSLKTGSASFYRKDLWKTSLQRYDNVVIFGVKEMMSELEIKLNKELKEDSCIVACRFPFPNLTPKNIIGDGIDTVWTYTLKKKL